MRWLNLKYRTENTVRNTNRNKDTVGLVEHLPRQELQTQSTVLGLEDFSNSLKVWTKLLFPSLQMRCNDFSLTFPRRKISEFGHKLKSSTSPRLLQERNNTNIHKESTVLMKFWRNINQLRMHGWLGFYGDHINLLLPWLPAPEVPRRSGIET